MTKCVFQFSFRSCINLLISLVTSVSDIKPTHTTTVHTLYTFCSSTLSCYRFSRFPAFLSTELIDTCTISLLILDLSYTNVYLFIQYINLSSCCIERTVVTALLSNRILRGNVQHPRYEHLRVQILQERWRGRSRVRQKKLWYALVGLCHGVSGIEYFKLKLLTDNPKQTKLAT